MFVDEARTTDIQTYWHINRHIKVHILAETDGQYHQYSKQIYIFSHKEKVKLINILFRGKYPIREGGDAFNLRFFQTGENGLA